jgi:(E)-4-hydroxy-3-methyl-but-2-enyl pyrophosphate reductase
MIKLARSAGFCMGVKRALDIVLELSRTTDGPIYTDGPLIHNPQIIALLERKGIKSLAGVGAPSRGLIVIRAHGVSPGRREALKRIGLPLYDATCPDVAKVQAIVNKYSRRGYEIAIVGDRGHAEVEGLLGYSRGLARVISGPEDVEALGRGAKVCVVAQTTQDVSLFGELAERIRTRVSECVVCDTICRSTKERQREAIALARSVDAMVVVGGRSSANTARLVKICGETGVTVFHVESEKDCDALSLHHVNRVGVTAGASTPHWVIERVVERLGARMSRESRGATRCARIIGQGLIRTHLYTALAAACLYVAASLFQAVPAQAPLAVALGACILCVHLANRIGGRGLLSHGEETLTQEYYHDHRKSLSFLAVVSGGLSLWIAAGIQHVLLLCYLALIVMGLYYSFEERIVKGVRRRGGWSLRMLPASKDIFVATAWMVAIVLGPRLVARAPWTFRATAACGYVFGLVFIRSIFHDLRTIHDDTIVGKETIPTLMGIRGTELILGGAMVGMCALLLASAIPAGLKFALAVPFAYSAIYFVLYRRRFAAGGVWCDALADGQFIAAGMSALIWSAAAQG